MEEVEHVINVLKQAKESLINKEAARLKELSNQTIHSASSYQDAGSVTLAVLIYTLSKIVEREDYNKIKNWSVFMKKFNSWLELSIKALEDGRYDKYESYLESIRKALSSASINYKQYIEEVLRKASINKASKIYEHGISLGRTSELLGITEWELLEYAGQKPIADVSAADISQIKKRVAMAEEFLS